MGYDPMVQRTNGLIAHDARIREWLKVRLADSDDARAALEIVERWRKMRQASTHLVRAIRLYAGLLKGDTTLMFELFPQFNLGGAPRPRRDYAPPVIEVVAQSEAQQKDDLLDLFGGGMEF